MRATLGDRYGSNVVGLGGVFVIEKGKAKFHIMVNFFKWFFNVSLVLL